MRKLKVLPADVFDALELSALVNGGVGAGCLSQEEFTSKKKTNLDVVEVPVCIIGHGLFLDGTYAKPGPVVAALAEAFGFVPADFENVFSENDILVGEAVSAKFGWKSYDDARQTADFDGIDGDECTLSIENKLTWKQWCKAVGVKRGVA